MTSQLLTGSLDQSAQWSGSGAERTGTATTLSTDIEKAIEWFDRCFVFGARSHCRMFASPLGIVTSDVIRFDVVLSTAEH